MKCEQIKSFIQNHKRLPPGYCFSITINNRLTYYGFLEKFRDYEDLLNQNKIRFVSIDQYQHYYWDFHNTGQQNKEYSIILDLTEISNIELIMQDRLNGLKAHSGIIVADETLDKREKAGN